MRTKSSSPPSGTEEPAAAAPARTEHWVLSKSFELPALLRTLAHWRRNQDF
jgi:hypothetical protein